MEEGESKEDEEESKTCGACTALSGHVFHVHNVPKKPHDNCKCGTVPLSLYIGFERLDERLEALEGQLKLEEEKIKALDKFKKSKEFGKNIEEAEKMRNKTRPEKWKWMYDNFQTGRKYDVKYGKPKMEHAGNFNYGAMGRATGLSEFELKSGAGFQQVRDGTSNSEFFYPWSWSYGDDPVDQYYIQEGINWYDENYGY